MLRKVEVTITSQRRPEVYYADLYPFTDKDGDGKDDRYEVPIYSAYVNGLDRDGHIVQFEWMALRFMPFWNPASMHYNAYKAKGYLVAGLNSFPKQAITHYIPHYPIHNHPSEYVGAIQLKGNFLIHAGPASIVESQWGGAGCVEIIGSFNLFRQQIMALAGTTQSDISSAMGEIVRARKLYVEIEACATPILRQVGNFAINKS